MQQGEQEISEGGEGRTKQWGTETLGDLWKEWGEENGVNKMDITGAFRKESREFEGGGFEVNFGINGLKKKLFWMGEDK